MSIPPAKELFFIVDAPSMYSVFVRQDVGVKNRLLNAAIFLINVVVKDNEGVPAQASHGVKVREAEETHK